MFDLHIYKSSTVEECQLAYRIALSGIDELLDAAPENVSRAKVKIMAAAMREELATELIKTA